MNELTVDGQLFIFHLFIVGFAEDAHARHSSNKFGFCTRSIASFIFLSQRSTKLLFSSPFSSFFKKLLKKLPKDLVSK